MKLNVALLCLVSCLVSTVKAQNFELVADINTDASNPYQFNSSPDHSVVWNNTLYFVATSPLEGREIFSYDGTNVQLEFDLNLGAVSSNPMHLTVFDNMLYFIAERHSNTDTLGLFKYDGTNAPQEVFNLGTELINNFPSPAMIEYNGRLMFVSREFASGNWELLSYDGSNPPYLIYSSSTGTATFSGIQSLTVMNGLLYFDAYASSIYQYDGVGVPSPAPYTNGFGGNTFMYAYNGAIYFAHNDGVNGSEIWQYDGASIPVMLADINPGAQSSTAYFNEAIVYNNEMYFAASDGTQMELWSTDGTTVTMIDVNPTGGAISRDFRVFNGNLYFSSFTNTLGSEMYVYDGSTPSLVHDFNSGIGNGTESILQEFQGNLLFGGNNGSVGIELYAHDGANSVLVENIYGGNDGSNIRDLITFQNRLYFTASGPGGSEPWYTDGVTTAQLADLFPGTNGTGQQNSSSPDDYFTYNGLLYFKAYDGNQNQLYEYDGVNPPTVSTVLNSNQSNFYEWNNILYFSSNDGVNGSELWQYDGVNTPSLVADINPGASHSSPYGFTEFNNKLVFAANNATSGVEVWEYDGLNAPVLVGDIFPGIEDSYPGEFTEFNGKLYFSAFGGMTIGTEIWEYDGTNPPVLTLDLWPGVDQGNWPNESYPSGFSVVNGKLYFVASSATVDNQLWEYDGTNVPLTITNYTPQSLTWQFGRISVINDVMYFWADAGDGTGSELYSFNGVTAPTITDELHVGPGRSRAQTPSNLVLFNGAIYMSADDGLIGGAFKTGELYRLLECSAPNATIVQTNDVLEVPQTFTSYQWYDLNGAIVGATSYNFTVTSNGSYYCEVTDANGCTGTSNTLVIDDLGVTSMHTDQFLIYPNPTTGFIELKYEGVANQIELVDIHGRIVFATSDVKHMLDLTSMETGVYIVRLTTNSGVQIGRLIKK